MPDRVKSNRAICALVLLVTAVSCSSPAQASHVLALRVGDGAPASAHLLYLPILSTTPPTEVMVGAGDIADCRLSGQIATADLVSHIPGTVITLGDNAYQNGSADEFKNCYAPTWGRFKARTRPAPGNHDYYTPHAAGYFGYFGAAAGDASTGYYSYDVGAWHIVVVNSNCGEIGGCSAGSPQEQWLRADLAAHPARCTLAYWHHPLFSSGPHGKDLEMLPIWQALYDYHAELVLSGHDHMYERFAPQTPDGQLDLAHGIRQFVVGTGGRSGSAYGPGRLAHSEVSRDLILGVIKLSLRPTGYDWEFVAIPGQNFHDSGSGECH
jgi:acid phosphatase type 7